MTRTTPSARQTEGLERAHRDVLEHRLGELALWTLAAAIVSMTSTGRPPQYARTWRNCPDPR